MNELDALLKIMRHRESLADSMIEIADHLRQRARVHDRCKLKPDQFIGFARIDQAEREHGYGSREFSRALRADSEAIRTHVAESSHHPEHHAIVADMGWLDIIEMVCDWKAAADTYDRGLSLRDGLQAQFDRLDFTPAQQWLIRQVVDHIDPQ